MFKLGIQFFAEAIYPVHNNKFYVDAVTTGTADTIIKGLENFAPAIDGNVETWYALDGEGWQDAMMTGKAMSIAFSGKRVYGDAGNDYIFGKMLSTGSDADITGQWELPSGGLLDFTAVCNVTTPSGGDTTNVDTFEFELTFKGKPAYTAPV